MIKTRREFLRTSVLGGALTWTVPSFIAQSFNALHARAADAAAIATGRDHPILVVLQLAGGNDGLNTIVPYTNDHYHRARPKLGLQKDTLLPLNDELAVPQAMKAFKNLYDDGRLAIVNGVGYPNPNRSHFRSTEIWNTASDSEKFEKHGWIGRYFDCACSGSDPDVGLSLGRQAPQAFYAAKPTGISLTQPQDYAFKTKGGDARDQDMAYRQMNTDADDAAYAGETIMEVPSGAAAVAIPGGSALDFLERTALDAKVSSDRVLAISKQSRNQAAYPRSSLANNLALVARLIAGGMTTRIYYLSQGGYDTHRDQAGTHQRLLTEFSEALKAFSDDLRQMGAADRVLVLTFSEFGRRLAQNSSGGTDHGAAAPAFLLGPKIQPGLAGAYPSLAPEDLDRGDLRHQVDFRSLYATTLQHWMRVPAEDIPKILGRPFAPLPLNLA